MTTSNGTAAHENHKHPIPSWTYHKQDYRCTCGRLLFVAFLAPGSRHETRCPKCGRLNTVEVPLNSTGQAVIAEMVENI